MTKNQQSLSRAISRGNAIIAFDNVTRQNTVVFRKDSTAATWHWAKLNKNVEAEMAQIHKITLPLSQSDILNSSKRNIFKLR